MARYRSVGRDKVLEQATSQSKNDGVSTTVRFPDEFKDIPFFKPQKDVYMLDVIGYVVTAENHPDGIEPGYIWHSRRYFRHSNIGVEDNSYVCLAKTFGKRCPICEYAKQGRNTGTLDKEQLAALRPKERVLLCVIDTEDKDEKIQLWDASQFQFGKLLDTQIADTDDPDACLFYEPNSGFSVRVRFSKEKFQGKDWFKPERIDFKKRKNNYDDSILDEVPPLDDILIETPYSELEEIFIMGDTSNKEDADSAPRSRHRARSDDADDPAPRSRRGRRDEPEPEDDPAPPPRSRRTKEPEPEPADDPAPKRPSRPSRSAPDKEEPDDDPVPPRRAGRGSRNTEPADDAPPARAPRQGRRQEPEPEPEDDAPPPSSKGRAGAKSSGSKCPSGFEFGDDCDKYNECDTCDVWDGCNAAARKRG